MLRNPEFFGTTTVGERGQIVLPIEIRKKFQIKAGDKLIVIGMHAQDETSAGPIMLFKAESLNEFFNSMIEKMEGMRKILKENEDKDSE
jgi:AbrB family looped-hinge helix DNA binding protein